jgi:glycosyltransferase involved in cell wall biosynthesis
VPLDLSIAMACRDNASTIEPVLRAVRPLATEIIAVDNGSTDGTIAILESFNCTIIRSPWLGHVKTKQLALDASTSAWTLCLDSDETVQPDLVASIERVVTQNNPQICGYELTRKVWYAGDYLHYAWQPEWRLRLVRKDRCAWGGMDPHDKMMPKDPRDRVERLTGVLRHDSFTTIEDQFRKQVSYARISAQGMVAAGHRGSYLKLVTSPVGAFAKQMIVKQAFRDGWRGWAAAMSTAVQSATKHALILEQARGQPRRES